MGFISGSGIGFAERTGDWAGFTLTLGAALLLLSSAAPPAGLELDVAGLRSAKGVVRICLTRDPNHYPACVDDGDAIKKTIPASQTKLRFDNLSSGTYAIALFHDENRNGRLDTLLGIPREGFGFSRNPPVRFGPPRFSAASFSLKSGEMTQRVQLKYLL
jgi:uncharacterized protein (DUF2141 family)